VTDHAHEADIEHRRPQGFDKGPVAPGIRAAKVGEIDCGDPAHRSVAVRPSSNTVGVCM